MIGIAWDLPRRGLRIQPRAQPGSTQGWVAEREQKLDNPSPIGVDRIYRNNFGEVSRLYAEAARPSA